MSASSFDATDSRAGIRVAGNSTAGGDGETSSTVGATEAGGDGRSGAISPDSTPNGTRTVASRTGARRGWRERVLVQVLVFYFVAVGYRATRTHSMSACLRL